MKCYSRVTQDMGMFYYSLHIAVKQESIELVKILLNSLDCKEGHMKKNSLFVCLSVCNGVKRTSYIYMTIVDH